MIIKKIGVIIINLIFISTLSLIQVKADEVVSTEIDTFSPSLTEEENKQINGAKYLIEYLRQGGSIDLTNKTSGYTAIDLLDDIADFFNGTLAEFFGDEGYWINNISETQVPTYIQLKEPKITSDVSMMLGLLPFLNSDSDVPVPSPDINYNTYLDTINGSGFFWRNYTSLNYRTVPFTPYQPFASYSYINTSNGNFMYDSVTTRALNFSDIITINIVSEDNITYSLYNVVDFIIIGQLTNISNGYLFQSGIKNNELDYPNVQFSPSYNQSFTLNYSGTLQGCFEFLTQKVRNVNIYVNGVLWSYVGGNNNHIDLGQGTFIENTNQPIKYDYPEATKIDLQDLIDRLDLLISNQNKIKFPDFSDLIVDENGQQAVAVVVVNKDLTVDDWYVKNYGTLIPLFPVFIDYPISMTDITTIATIGVKDVIPTDILKVLGIGLIGMLFVTWIHRLLE